MDLKRVFSNEGDGEEDLLVQDSKRRKAVVNSVKEAMGARYMQLNLPKIEPFLRKVVQEEVQNALIRHVHVTHRYPLQIPAGSPRHQYQLSFKTEIPHTLFTSSPIKTQNNQPIQICLTDAIVNQVVTSSPLSSARVEIVVLDGDFNSDEKTSWTETEFAESIVREREGKRPLLSGEVEIKLTGGVGFITDIAFTDNSSWRRNRRFRLGARVCASVNGTEEKVQEGVSSSFMVKDHRGESYKKHHPPALLDDVWRLEKIGKDGVFHKRLADCNISTVQDFLRKLVIDPEGLRNLLGSGMSNKMWEATIEHARECCLDYNKFYSYNSGQGFVLLLNCIYQPVGSIFGNSYCSLKELTLPQKAIVDKLKHECYKYPEKIMELNQEQAKNVQVPVDASDLLVTNLEQSTLGMSFALPHAPSEVIEDLLQITGTVPPQSPTAPNQFSSFSGSAFSAGSIADTGGLLFPGVRGENKNIMGCYSEMDTRNSCGDSIFLGSF
ncbi:Calmodulin-binding protein 60 B [Carex littledalei]|uniref:Calmodulin-binding protein 60 B n=1 Tax=Carex littledalei TaxID=544730 RepID=A0A833VEG2_9POAL|nr:Calmodulin-binding protein 60 B [Carex littledalei]